MSWDVDLPLMLRYLINDIDGSTYSDARLKTLIVIGASYVVQEVSFSTTYTVNIDLETISPDPTSPEDKDFNTLVVLKSACLLDKANYRTALRLGGASVKVGPSSVTQNNTAAFKDLIGLGPCALYDKAKFEFEVGDLRTMRFIIGPASGPSIGFYGGIDSGREVYND